MHKSVSILSIFLIASSFMIFGNIFPKAMAIELDGIYFETDETREYVNEMATYVEDRYQPDAHDYDNYEKSLNSYFVKEMKCNNINSNLNGLNVNTLPGSTTAEDIGIKILQGDEESNTFGSASRNNNGNFDVDCINNYNNQGGQGLAGPFSYAAITEGTTSQQSNNALTSQSNNLITNPTTTQSSNLGGVIQSSNIVPISFSSSPSSTLVNILPGNPN
jgi:hypothetical protein